MISVERDVALVGTGVAPLVAAQILMRRGLEVLVLNPDHDFFIENSEMGMVPSWDPEVLALQRADRSREVLEPEYPGSIESWARDKESDFYDASAPFLRSRSWSWFRSHDLSSFAQGCESSGWHPQWLEGLSALRRIPGFSSATLVSGSDSVRCLSIAKMSDIDVGRYRNGILEFVRSRLDALGAQDWVTSAGAVEPTAEGVRFYQGGSPRTVKLRRGIQVFRTPRLNGWLQSLGVASPLESEVWEEWTLISRDALDPAYVAIVGDTLVSAKVEGAPRGPLHELSVLCRVNRGEKPMEHTSFVRLGGVVQSMLKWDRFSVRDLKQRRVFGVAPGKAQHGRLRVFSGVDGPIVSVVHAVQSFCADNAEDDGEADR